MSLIILSYWLLTNRACTADNDNDLAAKMPNPWRVKAKGRPVYCVQLNLWQDDVSGNVSKQWNKHYMLCMTLAGIPKKLLFQEYFTHFVTCSPNASALELAKAFIEAVKFSFFPISFHYMHVYNFVLVDQVKTELFHSTP